MEIGTIMAAIRSYDTAYNRLPISSAAVNSSLGTGNDFTYGTFNTATIKDISGGLAQIDDPAGAYHANNSEVMAVLLALERYGNGQTTVNLGNVRNPERNVFLTAKMVDDTVSPGIGRDGVYRDPWGNPYVITLDTNGDGRARDRFYCTATVSEDGTALSNPRPGLNGLIRTLGNPAYFEANSAVMVWSAGPDGSVDSTNKANLGANKDNVLSWK